MQMWKDKTRCLLLTIPKLVEEINHDYPFANSKEKCTIQKEKMMLSSDECSVVKETTVQQHKTSKWEDCRLGRITASKAHEVITKYDDNLNIKNVKGAENLNLKRKWMPSLCSGADKMNQRQGINTEKNSEEITKVLLAKSQVLLFLPYTLTLQQVQIERFLARVIEMVCMKQSILRNTEIKL